MAQEKAYSASPSIDEFGDFLSRLFMKNPVDGAMDYYNQIPDALKKIFQPFMDAGLNSVKPYTDMAPWVNSNYMSQTNNLLNNPSDIMNKIGKNYSSSPGYEWQKNQALQATRTAAADGGMAGSPLEQQNAADISSQMANKDYYNYMGNALDMYKTGYSGLKDMYGTGANIASNMFNTSGNMGSQYASDLGSAMENQGNLQYLSQINNNEGIQSLFSDFF